MPRIVILAVFVAAGCYGSAQRDDDHAAIERWQARTCMVACRHDLEDNHRPCSSMNVSLRTDDTCECAYVDGRKFVVSAW